MTDDRGQSTEDGGEDGSDRLFFCARGFMSVIFFFLSSVVRPPTPVDRTSPRRYGPRAAAACARHRRARRTLGRSQVVRQRILIPPFPGSSPGAPATQSVCGGLWPRY